MTYSEGAEDDTGVVLSNEPYGLDPVFLPTSELYDGSVMPQVVHLLLVCVHAVKCARRCMCRGMLMCRAVIMVRVLACQALDCRAC